MSKKMVFKSSLDDERSKIRAMKAVAGCGVESITVEKEKGTITAVGEADPVLLAKRLRKLGYKAEVMSVGPAKEEKKDATEEEEKIVYHVIPSMEYPSYPVRDGYDNVCVIL